MIVTNPNDFRFIEFKKSKNKSKKYDAVLMNKKTGVLKRVPFGSSLHNQYIDNTGLELYSHLNHYDDQRRKNYRLRHHGEDKNKFSSGYFSLKILW
jgi:hypothetical protein